MNYNCTMHFLKLRKRFSNFSCARPKLVSWNKELISFNNCIFVKFGNWRININQFKGLKTVDFFVDKR